MKQIIITIAHGKATIETKGFVGSACKLETADLESVFDKLQASGAEVVQEPTDQPYGVRDCAFRDPAGNHIRIDQAA